MEQISGVENRFCVVWKTRCPSPYETVSSSKFSIRRCHWNLEFRFFARYPEYGELPRSYEIALRASIPDSELVKQFTVTTLLYIETCNKLPHICSVETIENRHHVLYSNDFGGPNCIPGLTSGVMTKIICIFHDLPPQELQSNGDTIHLSTRNELDSTNSLKFTPNLEYLSFDFSNLLKDKPFSDVKLNCGDRTISVHRAVLAARSEVFAAMFQNKMVESETGVVDIIDLDAQILDLLLKYMYTGKIEDLSEDVISSLYAASDRYAVHVLKKACSDWMIRSLTEENFLSTLMLADAYTDAAFKDGVVSFICSHEAVFQSENWLQFSKKPSELAMEVYQRFVTSLSKKS